MERPRQLSLLIAVLPVLVARGPVFGACDSGNDLLPPIPVGSLSVTLEVAADISPSIVIDITNAGDGSGRLFLVSPDGVIRIVRGGQVLSTPFLDEPASPSDRAMSGLAFHPQFASNGKLYVITGEPTPNPDVPHYVPPQDDTSSAFDNVLYEYQVSGDPDVVDPSSRRELLRVHQAHRLHNMNDLTFGGDGCLYVAMGDGGDTLIGAPTHFNTNAQLTTNPYGAVLRIDVDTIGPNGRYAIPPDNPFADGSGGNVPEIFAWGFRNPWRISADRVTGEVFLGNNGFRTIETIVHVERGKNYGWDVKEGSFLWDPESGEAMVDPNPDPQYTDPTAEYDHNNPGSVCFGSAIGGYVYRGTGRLELNGWYLFNDWVGGRLVRMAVGTGALEVVNLESEGEQLLPSQDITWGEDEAGELYVGSASGRVLRFLLDDRTAVPEAALPGVPELRVHPNPARGRAHFVFTLERPGPVELAIFDVAGRRVATLLDGPLGGGVHRATWPGGEASGVYRAVLTVRGERRTRSVTVLR